jgi:hypothetical protein
MRMALRDEGGERDWVYSYEKRSEMNREERAEFGCHCACGGLAPRRIRGDLFTDARKTGMSGVGACARAPAMHSIVDRRAAQRDLVRQIRPTGTAALSW